MIWHSLSGTKSVVTPAYRALGFILADQSAPRCSNPKRTATMAVCDPALNPADYDTAAMMSPDETSFLKAQHTTFQNLLFLLPSWQQIWEQQSAVCWSRSKVPHSHMLGGNWGHASVWFALSLQQREFTTSRRGRSPLVLVRSDANWMCFHHCVH